MLRFLGVVISLMMMAMIIPTVAWVITVDDLYFGELWEFGTPRWWKTLCEGYFVTEFAFEACTLLEILETQTKPCCRAIEFYGY